MRRRNDRNPRESTMWIVTIVVMAVTLIPVGSAYGAGKRDRYEAVQEKGGRKQDGELVGGLAEGRLEETEESVEGWLKKLEGLAERWLEKLEESAEGRLEKLEGSAEGWLEETEESAEGWSEELGKLTEGWLKETEGSTEGRPEKLEDSAKEATMSNAGREELVPQKPKPEDEEGKNQQGSSIGNLWDDWQGDMNFPGDGSKDAPFQLSSLAHLMGLSQAVAAGNTYEGKYFELTQDIHLENLDRNNGNWNPIGWYRSREEMGDKVPYGFSGNFDGCGYTISGLRISQGGGKRDYAGLFGWIDGGTVRNLNIEAREIYGGDKTAVLAGAVTGEAMIYNVQVSGCVHATGDAGGIAGVADGRPKRVTIENCSARGIVIYSEGGSSFVGGIAGQAVNADLVDNTVMTQNGDSDRIWGNGYTGGITGRMIRANLYNSYVEGTIGGGSGQAVGGITGLYQSGNLILARFAGDIGSTLNGGASREGTFVGTRQGMFTYGTEKGSNLSYLFTNTANKAKKVFGSGRDWDNIFTTSAHIGYWTNNGTKYVTVAGMTQNGCGDRYFYEELEDGVRHLVTMKLDNEFTAEGYDRGVSFRLDHFAPGYQGEPVKGYLLSVPRIDAVNSNGTYDTDVASLSAIPSGANTYYRTMNKDYSAAVAPGATVSVVTAANNTANNRYQMVMDSRESGGVKPPVYMDESGSRIPMTYVNGGSYSFRMPECNTQINAEYVKVTTEISMNPASTVIAVTQIRKGDRKNPDILTEVRTEEGILIARYINGNLDSTVEVQPVRIHAEHNKTGTAADRTVMWSVDDGNLLIHTSSLGYTNEDGMIMPNLNSSFIEGIVKREAGKQADNGYREPISPVVYEQSAVVTAASNPATSSDHKAVYGNCKVTVTLQILDQTTRRVEGLNLNQTQVVYRITRKLTGDRRNPTERITCTEPVVLAADLFPQQPFYKNVTWRDQESGQILLLFPTGENQENCRVRVRYDPSGKINPAWIQNVIQADNEVKKRDPYRKREGSSVHREVVTATSEDQTHGVISASCNVEILFETEDETWIFPEQIRIGGLENSYELSVVKTGNWLRPTVTYKGFDGIRPFVSVVPECPETPAYRPYNRNVVWSSGDEEALSVRKNGTMIPVQDAAWVRQVMKNASASSSGKAEGSKKIQVYAKAETGPAKGIGEIVLHLTVEDRTIRRFGTGSGSGGSGGGGSGSSSGSGSGSGTGGKGPGTEAIMVSNSIKTIGAAMFQLSQPGKQGTWEQTRDGAWRFAIDGYLCRDQWIFTENPYADPTKGQNTSEWFRFDDQGHMITGWFTDKDGRCYYLNPASDNEKGTMMTGWNWIKGSDQKTRCYYFQEHSDGYRGALFKNGITPDGYQVDGEGAWMVENRVQTKN